MSPCLSLGMDFQLKLCDPLGALLHKAGRREKLGLKLGFPCPMAAI